MQNTFHYPNFFLHQSTIPLKTNLKPIDRRHDQHVGTEVRPDHLEELDRPTHAVAPVKVRHRQRPDQLRQQREEGRQQVGQAEVEDEVVHAGHLHAAAEDGEDDADVADHGEDDDDGEDGDLGVVEGRGLGGGRDGLVGLGSVGGGDEGGAVEAGLDGVVQTGYDHLLAAHIDGVCLFEWGCTYSLICDRLSFPCDKL